ncbi:MAG: tRNA (N6-isopentenyl adenosine(37)-C2)-methylthiotransferase MiaB, partial [Symbiobacteriaceae bacterium]|nr:tRNA (N6-isopentenyl adenosine(37)-C2)-methylthiotransferase MiaB [Symbiobacteriaceae bacterium]
CGVRAGAESRAMGRIGQLKPLKEMNPGLLIVVCGCMTQQPEVAAEIARVHRHVNLITGTHNQGSILQLLVQALQQGRPLVAISQEETAAKENLPRLHLGGASAWVSIMYGCDNFCSYCIVPYLRGRERSRQLEVILEEVRSLVASGVIEVTLLGQNVNSYGKGLTPAASFPQLLARVAEIPGLQRIRFVTSHPRDISREMIRVMAEHSNICRHLHLPVQSGSTSVLGMMNRGYTREDYITLIDDLRRTMPDLALSTDIIVAFPGERDSDFLDTIELVRRVRFDSAFTFLYSPRPGTRAAELSDDCPQEIKQRRMEELISIQAGISLEKNQELIGSVYEVLVESTSKTGADYVMGRGMNHKIVNFSGSLDLVDTLQRVRIVSAASHHLGGELVTGGF